MAASSSPFVAAGVRLAGRVDSLRDWLGLGEINGDTKLRCELCWMLMETCPATSAVLLNL
jgi:hypothetical protein